MPTLTVKPRRLKAHPIAGTARIRPRTNTLLEDLRRRKGRPVDTGDLRASLDAECADRAKGMRT